MGNETERAYEIGARESLSDLLGQLATSSAHLVRDEMALARQEIREGLKELRTGIIMILTGACFGLLGFMNLCFALVLSLADSMQLGEAVLVVGIPLTAIGAGMALMGIRQLTRVTSGGTP